MNIDEHSLNTMLDALRTLKPEEPSPFLFSRIEARLREGGTARIVPASGIRLALIAFALLCLVNALIVSADTEVKAAAVPISRSLDAFPQPLY